MFGLTILAKPVRRESNRNLVNAVLYLASCSDTLSYQTIPSRHPHKPSRNRETLMLLTAITSKVKARNFRAVVRLLCSEETVTQNTNDTFEALKTKHLAAPSECRPATEEHAVYTTSSVIRRHDQEPYNFPSRVIKRIGRPDRSTSV